MDFVTWRNNGPVFYLIDSDKPWSHSTVNNPYDRSDNRVSGPSPGKFQSETKVFGQQNSGQPCFIVPPVLKHRYQRGNWKKRKKGEKERNTRKSENRLNSRYFFLSFVESINKKWRETFSEHRFTAIIASRCAVADYRAQSNACVYTLLDNGGGRGRGTCGLACVVSAG